MKPRRKRKSSRLQLRSLDASVDGFCVDCGVEISGGLSKRRCSPCSEAHIILVAKKRREDKKKRDDCNRTTVYLCFRLVR